MSTLDDYYDDMDMFFTVLQRARYKANNSWERNFVGSMSSRFDKYKMGMFISDKQKEILEGIANGKEKEEKEKE